MGAIALIPLIMQGIQAAIQAAPGVIAVVTKAKELITSLFTAGVITKEVQDALHQHVDAIAALVAAGVTPPAWQVEADPE